MKICDLLKFGEKKQFVDQSIIIKIKTGHGSEHSRGNVTIIHYLRENKNTDSIKWVRNQVRYG